MSDHYTIFYCPHCSDPILIFHAEIKCAIFRHGVIKSSGQQISPHAPKSECDYLSQNGLIYGCGKPFRVIRNTSDYIVEVCDYI